MVFDLDLAKKLCPLGDDIWFYGMAILNNKKIKLSKNDLCYMTYISPTREVDLFNHSTLFNYNFSGGNDKQINNFIKHFPEILDIIKSE